MIKLKIHTYKTLEEKRESFDCADGFVYGDIDFLFEKLGELQTQGNYIFRGVSNASYKLYNSAQREFLRRELFALRKQNQSIKDIYNNWISTFIDSVKAWNRNSISEYFKCFGLDVNDDLAFLSFMQHNGIPTPLIDFTSDPFIALFFATENTNYNSEGIGIDSCFSIYYIDKNAILNQALNADIKRKVENKKLKFEEFISDNLITIIDHDSRIHRVLNSMNIINQKGCFIFNWHPTEPLEKAYSDILSDINTSHFDTDIQEMLKVKINCINIHKCLSPKIKQELSIRKLIEKEFIYPEITLLKSKLIDDSICNLIK